MGIDNFSFSSIGGTDGSNIGADPNGFSPTDPSTNDPVIITRFLRQNEVVFVADSLCPDKVPNYFFDLTNVGDFCQKSNRLELDYSNNASIFAKGEGIIDVTSNAFARVLATSNNIVYIDQNYINLNVSPYGANTLISANYSSDNVVYQIDSSNNVTFQGKVQHFDASNGTLAILPINGTFTAAGNVANSVIYKLGSTVLTNAISFIRGNIFPTGGLIRSQIAPANVGTILEYTHSSGVFQKANGSNTLSMYVQANSNIAVGNTITITSGGAMGEKRTIVAVTSNNELVMNSALSGLTSNSKYTFGPHVVDEYGKITGIFNIPETEDDKFPVGERVFCITDADSPANSTYLMRATATYRATNSPKVPEPVVVPPIIVPPVPVAPVAVTPIVSFWKPRDPLAQTFYTPKVNDVVNGVAKSNYGMYISSVDLYFASKPILADLQLPVTIEIVTVENGIPTQSVLAYKTVECKNVNVSTVPDTGNTSTCTNFRFDDPVYLQAETQYALVVKSDSPDYNVFIAELGGSVLGASPPRRVSTQPYVGSLFKSQNASTWTPIQNQDLMFRINKAVFTKNQTGTALFTPDNQLSNVNIDSVIVLTSDINHKPTFAKYKFKSNNVFNQQDAAYTYIPSNSLYEFGADLVTSTKTSGRRRVLAQGDGYSFVLGIEMGTSDEDVSPLINLDKLSVVGIENSINDGSISNTDIAISSVGAHSNAANITVTISAPDLSDGVTANAYVSSIVANTPIIIVDNPGSGYITSNATITLSEPSASSNATANIAGETGASGGNCKARYVSRMITLATGFDAGDLRVYLDCNRPHGTNIHVYYKVKAASDPQNFADKNWKLMTKVADSFSADQNEIIELEYRPSLTRNLLSYVENGVTYPLGGSFKFYAIKIVLTAEDTTVVPTVRNYRAIATPSG